MRGGSTCPAAVPAAPSVATEPDLAWADTWARNVRDFVFVREEDSVFIQRPNKAFKLNPSAIRILKRLFAGEPIATILAPFGKDPRVRRDTERFLLDLRHLLAHGLPDTYASPAVDRKPFGMNFSPLPVISEIAVTYRCNAACSFCYAGCNETVNPVGSASEMTLDEVRRVLDRIAHEAQVPSVSFTGGEATLRDDLPDMIRHARSLGMRVNLVTNGIRSASPEVVASLVAAGLHSAQVSVEGTTAGVHEGITRIPGSFDATMQGIRNFTAAGIRVHTNTTICRDNIDDVLAFPVFVRDVLRGERFSMNLCIPTGSASLRAAPPVLYRDVAQVLPRILAASRAAGIEFLWYSPTPVCIFNPVAEGLGNKGCSACDGLLSVGADGSLLPCASWDRPLGSIVDRPFRELWTSPEATALRAKSAAPEHCRACEHLAVCNGACPLYWRQVGCGELDEARAAVDARAAARRSGGAS
ncbi:MAG: radical SAM protein [Planctomycetes bacterium]|nr:radical SAM protein [Planctomycetota bacterium]